jgi:hypothetical protein
MNYDEKNPDTQPGIGPELEARMVAWVAGEASAFEAAELERLTGERPELAIFKRRIEAVQGLVAEAVRPDKEPLRLSPERRASLLQAIGAAGIPEETAQTGAPKVPRLWATRQWQAREHRWMLAVAACVVFGGFLFLLSVPSFQKVQYEGKSRIGRELHMDRESRLAVELPVAMPSEPQSSDYDQAPSLADVPAVVPNATYAPVPPRAQAKGYASAIMAPMVAQAPSVDGYQATSTLAGKRMRTELKDVTSAISVTTQEFLKSTGASNSQNLLRYTGNTEVAGQGGNYLADADKETGTYVRGLDWAEKTGDFGQAETVSDARVAGRAERAPGVDSLRFGVGGPADRKGQISAGASDESKVKLSPFTIAGFESSGYSATDTIASSRLKKQANDIPAKTEVSIEGGKRDSEKAAKPVARPEPPAEISVETNAAQAPVSTFSLHVSDVSFRLAQAALARGEEPDPALIRPEEFYNAFDYGDPAPAPSEKIACRIEQSAHPFLQQRNLVRIAMRVPATGRGAGQPLRLTVLLDTSGSMEREDRAAAVRRAMAVLASLLGPNDRLTLVGFARRPRLLAEQQPGDQVGQLLDLIARTPAEGGTNFEEALKLGGELARRHFEPQAQNRLVLLTDGAANLGNANPTQLARTIETLRQQGIAFDACGVGMDGLDDTMLEALTRKGDGRYYLLDTPASADAGFARQLAGAFRPAAINVKVQVRFNPARVGHYRLIGFEHHRLRAEDFRNDQVDAAELAAEEAAVALYQVEARPQGEGELGEVYVRFRDAATGNMIERSWTMTYEPQAPAFDRATPSMQLAGTAALLAEKLRGGASADPVKLDELAPVVNTLRGRYEQEARVQQLVTMFAQMRRLDRK